MKITLLGVLGALALAALLIYVGHALFQQPKPNEPPQNPPPQPENS
jgi:hypothetical protein